MGRKKWRFYDLPKVMNFLIEYKKEHDGNSPDLRTIMRECDISSLSVVKYMLEKLEAEGKIRLPRKYRSRGIEIVGGQWTFSGN